jgi:hypothetical protein
MGTFAVLYSLGYSANTLSLFAIILALTMVVDDAIVVVESVETLMAEGQSRTAATALALRQIAGPVIATTLVLLAVFVPVALLPGIVGELYRQFAVTLYRGDPFKPGGADPDASAVRDAAAPRPQRPAALFRGFNRGLDSTRRGYTRLVSVFNRRPLAGAGGDRCGGCGGGVQLYLDAKRLPAAGRSGLLLCQRSAAGSGLAGAYRSGDGHGARAYCSEPGGGGCDSGLRV